MKITSSLKSLLQSKGVKPDATEQEYKAAAYSELAKGDAAFEKAWQETQSDPDAATGSKLMSVLEGLASEVKALKDAKSSPFDIGAQLKGNAPQMPDITKAMISGTGESTNPRDQVNVIPAHKQYDSTRKTLKFPETRFFNPDERHPFSGQELYDNRRRVNGESQLDMALCGAFWKFMLSQNNSMPGLHHKLRMTDHDRDLMTYALNECEWGGVIHGESSTDPGAIGVGHEMSGYGQKLRGDYQKAVLDDATSGGLEAAPIFFDDMLITIPLLHSEFYPKVEVVNVTRGRRIEGASIGTVTLGAGTEGSAVSLFNTANFIAAFDTTIFVVTGAIEIGLDFLSDSPIDIAGAISRDYQQVLLQWLDSQIIGGDGTTEPEGILNASGTTTVNATNGAGGPWTVGDVETLLFGVSKAYKGGTDPNRIGFGSLETTYRRIRAIAVSTSDQRRVFGMSHEDYRVLFRFWGIGSSSTGGFTSNRQAVFGNFSRYRMYRRLGMTVRVANEGVTAIRANTMTIVPRARFGGQLTDGSSFAVCTDGQS